MIKCFGFGKLLKQLFIISLISFFGLLGSSFVNASSFEWEFHDVNSSFGVYNQGTFQQKMLSSSAGVLEGGGMFAGKGLIMLQVNAYNLERRYIYFWGSDNQLYAYGNNNGTMSNPSNYAYVRFNSFYRYNLTGFVNSDYYNLSKNGELVSATSFYQNSQLKGMMTRFAFLKQNDSNNYTAFCWVYDSLGFSICVKPALAIVSSVDTVPGLSINPNDFDTSLIGTSPRTSSVNTGNNQVGDGGDLEGINYVGYTGEDLINYFENNPYYKFNKNVCYVGTNDYSTLLSSVYNSGLSLNIGTGGDIFDLYLAKYGNDFTIKQLGSFINTRRSNYGTIFFTNEEDRLYWLEYYDGFVHQFYTDLTINRFLTSPYVFYNLGQITYNFSSQSSVGEEIATYCYYKLGYNKDFYSGGLNIIDNHDSSYDENALNYKGNYLRNNYHFTGGIIVSESWVGTPLDYLDGTGEDNLDFATFFNKSFNRFKSVFDLDTSTLPIGGFLPTYIIMFLLAIIFFRFISH